ncbi:carbamoyltransferase HypF [Methylocystis parvus]|uniref:Carbamoyltransferase HypF n=1 Tax=Methylocystis parvus TaxID=134 RepID=A0A6B8M1S1_9HYPH|nr:carbamoyltransferase HypF [Methylocystis parvus]QGM96811.1 carbamoyltransferase HypF [Methylocystis parvus]WBJ99311.1 carbamoyltransferase HypF [Methylocystis parvus OBBP]
MASPAACAAPTEPERRRLRLRGAVQGVGFRPFVYNLALRYGLSGFVQNDGDGVLIEVEGAPHDDFLRALRGEKPPLAVIDSIDVAHIDPRRDRGFTIRESAGGNARTRIVADAAVCEACLDELFDPESRFHLYPFVTCTHCGPRFTITSSLPYDRPQTSMARFSMCEDCARDYGDPKSRRFHAETIACPKCGPRLERDPQAIVSALRAGRIVALKGIGGFHLICDARNEAAVDELRRRKARDAKPFAVMAANIASVSLFAAPSEAERDLLRRRARPIVVLPSKGTLPRSIAPGLARIGVMLPYAPLHHLLFHAAAGFPAAKDQREAASDFVIVATSANPGGEPLVVDDDDARRRLSGIADLIVGHDRPILVRADDSVMAVAGGAPIFLRRARGFVPEPIDLGADGPCAIAFGAHLKTTVTVTRGREAFVSQHIGDLDDAETVRFFEETTRHLVSILNVRPEIAACDAHPDFFSTRIAEETGLPLYKVQHHAAHVAAIAAEHGTSDAILGAALDGYGMGDDGGAWGGELMLLENASWKRLGHLAPLALIGGDRAAREPWRMGMAALAAIDRLDLSAKFFPDVPQAANVGARMRKQGAARTTSMGRLFDAVAALAGVCPAQRYEGQAAMELEALVESPRLLDNAYRLRDGVLDFAPFLAFVATERPSARETAEYFHGALIDGCADWIAEAAGALGLQRVALGGGCLMNRALADGLCGALRARGIEPLCARLAPCNDGGISLGQAALARAAFQTGRREKESAACV